MVERAFAMAPSANVTNLSPEDRRRALRVIEAVIFASAEPVATEALAERVPDQHDIEGLLRELQQAYAGRGVHLVQVAGKWAFRTADDLSFLLSREVTEPRRLSRAAMETLAIVAYHQPVTRAEIEDIRGVLVSRGTLDLLLETGWVRMRGRRRAPGRPITYGVTDAFLEHFGLNSVADLPGIDELKGAGLLESAPAALMVPEPRDLADLADDEEPLAEDDPGTDIL
jgi:segregation and condensation protein B